MIAKSKVYLPKNEEILNLQAFSVIDQESNEYLLNVEIIPPSESVDLDRKAISLVCILDTSESMSTDALKDGKDKQSHGFSRLDLVKHSMNTIVQLMGKMDELTLIVFNTSAVCVMRTTRMNENGKKNALKIVGDLEAEGTTNIW